MKATVIFRWPDLGFPYFQRAWIYDLKDGILEEKCIRTFEKVGRKLEEWHITISDEDACILRLKYPKIQFIE